MAHAVTTDPGSLWTTNAFSRAPDNLAYTDTILGYLPVDLATGAAGGGQGAALAALNIAGSSPRCSPLCGGYALARALGAGPAGSLVAGAGFGLAPWRVEQVDPPQRRLDRRHRVHARAALPRARLVAAGRVAARTAAAMGRRGRAGPSPAGRSPSGSPPASSSGTCSRGVCLLWAAGWLRAGRPRLPRALLVADGAGAVAFGVVTVLLVRPYLRVLAANPGARRSEAMLPPLLAAARAA